MDADRVSLWGEFVEKADVTYRVRARSINHPIYEISPRNMMEETPLAQVAKIHSLEENEIIYQKS